MANEEFGVRSSINTLTNAMEAGFAGLRAELDKLRLEFKHEIEGLKGELKSLKESISFTQGEVETLKEKSKENLKETNGSLEELNKTIADLEEKLKAAAEDNIKLEQYTRRENLRFNNIMEEEGEVCKSLIYEIIQNEMGVDTAIMKFHAVHRVGKRMEGRCRPIIARFISREDIYIII